MRRMGIVASLVICVILGVDPAFSANRVRVESQEFRSPGLDTIAIYVDNDVNILGLVVPLELRSFSNGAFITAAGFTWGTAPTGRVANSPLGAANPAGCADDGDDSDCNWPGASITNNRYPNPEASPWCSKDSASYATSGAIDAVSPNGLLFASVSQGNAGVGHQIYLAPGADPQGTPSMRIICTLNGNQGIFFIDSCCVRPANHIGFAIDQSTLVVPEFVRGNIGINTTSAVKSLETGSIPDDYSLAQNYPNPFNAGTIIRFSTKSDGDVKVDVYNILGRKVRTLVDQFLPSGTHQTDWDGRSDDGIQVATGVYFYRISAGDFKSTRKMVLLK